MYDPMANFRSGKPEVDGVCPGMELWEFVCVNGENASENVEQSDS